MEGPANADGGTDVIRVLLAAVSMAAVAGAAAPALAAAEPARPDLAAKPAIPAQLTSEQRTQYRAVFAAIRDGRWQDAQIGLDAMAPGPLHSYARAELYTAKGSSRVEMEPVSYTHLRAHETRGNLVCRLLLEK